MTATALKPLRPHQQRAIDGLKQSIVDGAECWRPVKGYEGRYEVSDLGRIRSIQRTIRKSSKSRSSYDYTVPARMMRQPLRAGYPSVTLYRDAVKVRESVHRIVAAAFLGAVSDGLVVCHIDGDRRNNRASNLRLDTPAANSADMISHGKSLVGTRNHLAKLTPDAVRVIRASRGVLTQKQLAARFGVSKAAIGYVQRGSAWRHING